MGKNEKRYLSPAAMRLFAFALCLSVVLSMVGCASEVPETTTTGSVTTTVTQVTTVQVTTTVIIPNTQPSGAATTSATMPTTVPTVTDPVQTTAPTVPTVPTEPKTTEPKPTEAKPTEPKPTETVPTTPKPTEPKPTEPKPTETVPTTPKPTEPKPTETVPTTPKPTEPKPTEPVPTQTKPTDVWDGEYSGQAHTPVGNDNRYLYTQLEADLQLVYRKIDEAVRNLEPSVYFDVDITYDDRHQVYYMYMADHPELFYLGSKVTISYGGGQYGFLFTYSDGQTSCGHGTQNPDITEDLRAGILAKKAAFDAEVARIAGTIPADAPAVVKERMIYDYILENAQYNLDAVWDDAAVAQDDWTAYGVLFNQTGVCESYSEAFQTLCYAVGINCTGINGDAGGPHKWNAVQLDGEWYLCDITFDDPVIMGDPEWVASQPPRHDYFNITTQEMLETHHHPDEGWPVPECTATKYSYANYFGGD